METKQATTFYGNGKTKRFPPRTPVVFVPEILRARNQILVRTRKGNTEYFAYLTPEGVTDNAAK